LLSSEEHFNIINKSNNEKREKIRERNDLSVELDTFNSKVNFNNTSSTFKEHD